jgi:hypothetical protein
MKKRFVMMNKCTHSSKPVDGQIRATETDEKVRTLLCVIKLPKNMR